MKEQSHKEDMRAALRGDFERLRARQAGAAKPAAHLTAPRAAERVVLTPPSRPLERVEEEPAPVASAAEPVPVRVDDPPTEPRSEPPRAVAAGEVPERAPEPEWRPWLRALLRRR